MIAKLLKWFHRSITHNERAEVQAECFEQEGCNVVQILHSCSRWRRVRNDYYRLYPRCAACGYDKQIQVHHIVPWHVDESLRYDMSNLVSLCQPCHFRYGHFCNWRSWNPLVDDLCITMVPVMRKGRALYEAEKSQNIAKNSLISG